MSSVNKTHNLSFQWLCRGGGRGGRGGGGRGGGMRIGGGRGGGLRK